MGQLYAMRGPASGELLTFEGQIIVHDNPDEVRWLVKLDGMQIVPVHPIALLARPSIQLRDHPAMVNVRWPLDPRDFIRTAKEHNPDNTRVLGVKL